MSLDPSNHSRSRRLAGGMCRRTYPWTSCHFILPVLLHFLLTFAQGQGQGRIKEGVLAPVDDQVYFEVEEEKPPRTLVGTIPMLEGLTYIFSDEPALFVLDGLSGQIWTKVVIDREKLASDTFDLFVQSVPLARHLIEVHIRVLDINDNSPRFGQSSVEVVFSERDQPGTQVILDTAVDPDAGKNGVTTDYRIVSGNEDGRFGLVLLKDTSIPLLYLENRVELDREERSSYLLRISVPDGGTPPRFGYLQVNVTVRDFNDNQPIFDQSYYSVQMNETCPPGTSVIKVKATDNDIGPNGDITYHIITDDYHQFAIDALTGVLTTTKTLHCRHSCDSTAYSSCSPNSCLVTVEARDKAGLSGRAYITITLMDENDHDPVIRFQYFSQSPWASLDESASTDDIVAFVLVSDQDNDANGQTTVTIVSGNELGHFHLVTNDLPSNLLTVVGPIDREKVAKYNLTFEARDHGNPPRHSTAFLVIVVNDVNDHAPVFQQQSYHAELSELSAVGSFVASVTALDNDTGINAIVTYAIISGNELGWFAIDRSTGLVTTRTAMDHEVTAEVRLEIEAQDGASEPLRTRTNLSIQIWDENDEVPKFDEDTYRLSMVEGTRSGTEIITVSAVDNDQGRNGTITYSFTPDTVSSYPNLLYLNQVSGKISLNRSLDREEFSHLTIKVKATDQGTPSLSSTATILVDVLDLNDNVPVFYPQTYYTSILENQPPDTKVIQVQAKDPDAAENGTVFYSIVNGAYQKFSINIVTGMISTRSSLDREQRAVYKLTVTARDTMYRYANVSAIVEVAVADIQDMPPTFTQDSYTFSILEDDGRKAPAVGRIVGSVYASTEDEYAVLRYDISGGDPEGRFVIDAKTGEIMTATPIDREHKEFYLLEITAIGGQMFGTTHANITIIDINDNKPSFQNDIVEAYVVENWPVGHGVYIAKAEDPDADINGRVHYTLAPGSSNIFDINPDSAMITLAASLQYVSQTSFDVRVIARDQGSPSLSSAQSVHITVVDVNNHTPLFEMLTYEVSVSEALPVNDRFFSVTATDDDTGTNGDVTYHIVSGNEGGQFGIFPDGVLYIAKSLDRESHDMYVLTIRAVDGGVEPRSSQTNVTVRVLDANDNPPQFVNDTFHFYIEEASQVYSSVGIVSAVDNDTELNAEISYKIDGENKGFGIHSKTGVLFNSVVFDREELIRTTGFSYVTLTVVAVDTGLVSLQSKVQVYIHVIDVNDNKPQFVQPRYEVTLMEDIAVAMPVVRLSAVDLDTGKNALVNYTIISGNDQDRFVIDGSTGQISINAVLDRETVDEYTLTVMAKDNGLPPLNTTTEVHIIVEDANDNAPVFILAEDDVQVVETADVGDYVTQVTAVDADYGSNAFLSYHIIGGNIKSAFRIDTNTGRIYVASELDYENRNRYILNISVLDSGDPQLGATSSLKIEILDYNDNAPRFPSTPLHRQVREDIRTGTSVLKVTATDPDYGVNGEVRYSIRQQDPEGNHFGIDPDTGVIRVKSEIDRELADEFRLYIVATDQAQPITTRKSSEKLVTVTVTDINDNAPRFVSMNAAPVLLNSHPDTLVMRVVAVDPDSGRNGEVTYEILSGDKKTFRIDALSGQLYTKSTLTSHVLTYDLTLIARDGGTDDPLGAKSTVSKLTIFVQTSLDTGPQFSQASYVGQVLENQPAETSVLTVRAAYGSGLASSVEYYLTRITSGGKGQDRLFQVNPTSGVVTTTQSLDREVGYVRYELEIYAVDRSSTTPQTRKCTVQITVLDVNDSPPQFDSNLYRFQVTENVDVGYEITKLLARDPDEEGTVTYSITEGAYSKFYVEAVSGSFQVLNKLDRETTSSYKIKVTADDGKQNSSTFVIIEVLDVNDEKPAFTEPWYYFDIKENAPISTVIGQISASDADFGINADITYSISSHWGREKFSLHPHDGTFTLTGQLDFEEVEHYVLTVKAQDGGTPSLSTTVTVYMNVLDINDNSPVFDPSSYDCEVWENSTVGTSILTVQATDIDSGENAQLQYTIISGNSNGHFAVDPANGVLSVVHDLDRETIPIYILEIKATDNPDDRSHRLSGIALVRILIQDINDNAPLFVSSPVIQVLEGLPSGSAVYTIQAIDMDQDRNSYLEYYLDDAGRQIFDIDRLQGTLTTKVVLDRESIPEYRIKIGARDQGIPSLSTTMSMTVRVSDANDHSPVFNPKTYTKEVSEDLNLGSIILQLTATDDDEGLNSEIRYTIVSGDDNHDFYLDSHVGELTIQQHLDYERKKMYTLVVVARDLGDVPRSDTATVTITVTDVNDCVPMFLDSPYVAYVQENTPDLPVHVIQVMARDDDSASNSKVMYFIESQDEDMTVFSMNSTTGIITATQAVDREMKQEYQLIITAVDSGTPRLTGTGQVTVFIEDDNDNVPRFQYDHYLARIEENRPAGTEVVKVSATDNDHEQNAVISFSLVTNGEGRFNISSATGQVLTTTELDREDIPMYELVVMATDSGGLPHSSSVTVTVTVLDVNDNSPLFKQSNYNVYIRDPTPADSFIIGVLATDSDSNENAVITYSLLNNEDASHFNMDFDRGIITAHNELSSNIKPDGYTFKVRATDKGQNPRLDEVYVSVTFLPKDSQYPVITSTERSFRITEDAVVGQYITTITAVSSKPGAVLTFHIAGGNTAESFIIQPSTGVLSTQRSLDFEKVKNYNLWIEARDDSDPPLSDYIMLNIDLEDINDNWPVFDRLYYNGSVSENRVPDTGIVSVSATDADSGNNGQVTFRISDGNTQNEFWIDPDTGNIHIQKMLDREVVDFYQLVVIASDNGVDRKSATATVDLKVLDVNDNPPRFSGLFSARIAENAPIGQSVIRITCTDQDISPNNIIKYSINSDDFVVDNSSGDIRVRRQLDREVKDSYTLRVYANDGTFQAETDVVIDVMDVNDNHPEFGQNSYSFSLVEQLPPGTFIGRVQATDRDIPGPNSLIYYRLSEASELFRVDAQTGEVTSRLSFVYKNTTFWGFSENVYHINVLAIDQGDPPLNSKVPITINIKPANKHAPQFYQSEYTAPIAENAVIGQTVLQLNASDNDYASNAEIEYFKVDGNGTLYVNINTTTGVMTVANSLSGLAGQQFLVQVEARDHGIPPKSSAVNVILKIAEVNRYAPRFTDDTVFQVMIPESQAVGSIIATVTATDQDRGQNGLVSYYITGGDETKMFSIDESGGWLRVRQALDYELAHIHYLNITARDRGLLPKQTTKLFTVYLSDVNDNPPVFKADMYNASIQENAYSGTVVLDMNATDADTPDNSIMAYSLLGPSEVLNVFTINDTTGVIRCQGRIDYEKTQSYLLTVKVINPGTSLSGSTQVNVSVRGVNEFIPTFTLSEYEFVVSESSNPGSPVGVISATDQDLGVGGKVTFYLIGDSNMKGFSLDPDLGLLSISSYVDREATSEVVLDVLAKNEGPIHGNDTSRAVVHVIVRDSNDAPQFTQSIYEEDVSENIPLLSSVTQVSAIDNDVLPNDHTFSYIILAGNEDKKFEIEPASGWIYTMGTLDRETTNLYTLRIGAVDKGTPPKTGTTTVRLHVTDINDSGPYFNPEIPVGHILEERTPYIDVIITLSDFTFDLDLPPQAPYMYTLRSHTDIFDVTLETGQVKSKVRLDRESVSDYLVSVEVMDAGTPTMTSTLTFSVQVEDINDSPSMPRPLTIHIWAFQSHFPGGKIADVKPLDQDTTGNYNCQLISGDTNLFSIPMSCDLHLAGIQDMSQQYVNIQGNDGIHSSVDYACHISFNRFDENAMVNSVVIVLSDIRMNAFLDLSYDRFLNAISDVFTDARSVALFAMQEVKSDQSINLFVSVEKTLGGYLSKAEVTQRILVNKNAIERAAGIEIDSVNEDPCSGVPCENGGVCNYETTFNQTTSISEGSAVVFTSPTVRQVVKCVCPEGFQGEKCDEPVDGCQTRPCQNGGTCLNLAPGQYKCDCLPSWTGLQCELDVNECHLAPCQNGATCVNTAGSYSCVCPPLFTGQLCDQTLDPCASGPCQNEASCVPVAGGSYSCLCRFGDRGENCEVTSQGFQTLSYLEYRATVHSQVNFLSVELATTSTEALLLYYPGGHGDFLALEIVDSQVRFSFKIGADSPVRVTVPRHVTDGRWYRIEAERTGKVGSLRVSQCPDGQVQCDGCLTSDPNCFSQGAGQTYQLMNTFPDIVYVAGVADIQTILQNPGQLSSHDFSGCLRDFIISGKDLQREVPLRSSGISDTCMRPEEGVCTVDGKAICQNDAVCFDEWDAYRCQCTDGYTGSECEHEVTSFSFSPGAMVTYKQKESYYRDQLIKQQTRVKRSTNNRAISLTFITKVKDGSLFYSKGRNGYMQIYLLDGQVTYRSGSSQELTLVVKKDTADSKIHNMTFNIQGDTVSLFVDSTAQTLSISGEVYDPLSLDVEVITLGGVPEEQKAEGAVDKDFNGCLDDFMLDGEKLPLDGATERFDVSPSGNIDFMCALTGTSTGPSTTVTITVIVVFFGLFLILILVIILVIRWRRQKARKRGGKETKQNDVTANKSGGPALNKTPEGNGNHGQDSGFGDQGESEEVFIRQHIANQLSTTRNSARTPRPDLVESEPTAVNLRAGDIVLENGGVFNEGYNEEPPEHYDIDNASSIAPSDLVDIVAHYRRYRNGNLHPRAPSAGIYSHHHKRHNTSSPSSHPDSLTSVSRDSPMSLSSQQSKSPRTRKHHKPHPNQPTINPNRHSPHGHFSNIPTAASSLRSTPLSGISALYPQSIDSSYNERTSLKNTGRPNSGLRHPISQLGLQSTQTIGLTVDDIHRMNTHSKNSPSTMDMLSSSSDETGNKINQTDFTHADLLDPAAMLPPETSSEESANDSFTCSEFEYDNDQMHNGFTNRGQMIPQLMRVDEDETDNIGRRHGSHSLSDSTRDDSFSTFFTSEDELSSSKPGSKKLPPNALNLEYLLNWGPDFDKLVGVFTDIAQLPDSDSRNHSAHSSRPPSRTSPKPVSPYPKVLTPTSPLPVIVESQDSHSRQNGLAASNYDNHASEEYV